MSKPWLKIFFILGLVFSEEGRAEFLITLGGSVGTVGETKEDGTEEVYSLGGTVIGSGYMQSIGDFANYLLEFEALIDYASSQVARQAFNVGIMIHLLGGASQYHEDYGSVKIEHISSYGLSLVGKTGLHNYAASDPEDPSISVKGGMLQFIVGLAYRTRYDNDISLGMMLSSDVKSFPTSVNRLSAQTSNLGLFLIF